MTLAAPATHELIEATHTHVVNGVAWPSVTQILGFVPPVSTFLDSVRPEVLREKAEIGRLTHIACHYYDDDDLNGYGRHAHVPYDAWLRPRVRPYVDAWVRFRRETGFVPTQLETLIHHPVYGYAGRLDRIGVIAGARVVIEIKTGFDGAAGPQTKAYAEAWAAMTGEQIYKRRCVRLEPDASYHAPPRETDPKARRDWPFFLAALEIWNFNKGGKR